MVLKIWCICILINLIVFFILKDIAVTMAKTHPAVKDHFTDLSDKEILNKILFASFIVSLAGPLLWVYWLIKCISK